MKQPDLNKILDLHKLYLKGDEKGVKANLRYADLSDADLRYADLSDANLRYATLRNADLRKATLKDANLRYADFGGTDLREADLRGVKGILSFTGEKHLLIYFKTNNEYYFKIGCKTFTANEWIENFKEIGKEEGYSENNINIYGKIIKTFSEIEL